MDVYIREDVTVDEFIDVLIGNRRYVNCLYLYNKIDTITMEEVDRLARQPYTVVCSVNMELNLDGLKKAIWQVSIVEHLLLAERNLAGTNISKTDLSSHLVPLTFQNSNLAYSEYSQNQEVELLI